jgi:hypothetical protein
MPAVSYCLLARRKDGMAEKRKSGTEETVLMLRGGRKGGRNDNRTNKRGWNAIREKLEKAIKTQKR